MPYTLSNVARKATVPCANHCDTRHSEPKKSRSLLRTTPHSGLTVEEQHAIASLPRCGMRSDLGNELQEHHRDINQYENTAIPTNSAA